MQKISPFLWFDDQAEEAANFYVSIFKDSRILNVTRYVEGSHKPVGTAMTVSFVIEGQEFMALNGGPEFKFTPAISFLVNCENQGEVDALWEKLTEGGLEMPCAWLTDKFGISWQIVPKILGKLLSDPDPIKAKRVTMAMLKMGKIDIAELERAYNQID
jgi:predicted 3-demethylubiquinone-9 3-methyltransferase (glyoxalase superfamily)